MCGLIWRWICMRRPMVELAVRCARCQTGPPRPSPPPNGTLRAVKRLGRPIWKSGAAITPPPRRDQDALLQVARSAPRRTHLQSPDNRVQSPCGNPQSLLTSRHSPYHPHRIIIQSNQIFVPATHCTTTPLETNQQMLVRSQNVPTSNLSLP